MYKYHHHLFYPLALPLWNHDFLFLLYYDYYFQSYSLFFTTFLSGIPLWWLTFLLFFKSLVYTILLVFGMSFTYVMESYIISPRPGIVVWLTVEMFYLESKIFIPSTFIPFIMVWAPNDLSPYWLISQLSIDSYFSWKSSFPSTILIITIRSQMFELDDRLSDFGLLVYRRKVWYLKIFITKWKVFRREYFVRTVFFLVPIKPQKIKMTLLSSILSRI